MFYPLTKRAIVGTFFCSYPTAISDHLNPVGMGGPCEMGPIGDKISYFWIYQFLGNDRKPEIVAETEDRNTVRLIDIN